MPWRSSAVLPCVALSGSGRSARIFRGRWTEGEGKVSQPHQHRCHRTTEWCQRLGQFGRVLEDGLVQGTGPFVADLDCAFRASGITVEHLLDGGGTSAQWVAPEDGEVGGEGTQQWIKLRYGVEVLGPERDLAQHPWKL